MLGIICPTDKEANYIYSCLAGRRNETIGRPSSKIKVTIGDLNGISIALCICGYPKQSSIHATALSLSLDIDQMICLGSAGGLSDHVEIGDLIVASDIVFHDADPGVGGVQRGTLIDGFENYMFNFKVDSHLQSICVTAAKEIAKRRQVTYHIGRVLSGDQFITPEGLDVFTNARLGSSENHIEQEPLCIDMESGGVALTGTLLSIPFAAVRFINNLVKKSGGVDKYEQWKSIDAPRDTYEFLEAVTLEFHNLVEV